MWDQIKEGIRLIFQVLRPPDEAANSNAKSIRLWHGPAYPQTLLAAKALNVLATELVTAGGKKL
jgi:hypothetical protein